MLYLLHPSLRALILRLHTQLHSFINFVLSLDRPIPHPNGTMMGAGPQWDARATVLAKENVRDVLGKTGIDILEWGKAIQTLSSTSISNSSDPSSPTEPVSEDEHRSALLTLSCDPLKPILREILAGLPAPSPLFRATLDSEVMYDGITLTPLLNDGKMMKCGRCEWKTSSPLASGAGIGVGMGKWGEWTRRFKRVCVCGGSWSREAKRYHSGSS